MGSASGYAELHCHTNFSFLDGASHPEELAEEAARLGLAGLAVTDHDGLYGAVRFALGGARARPADGLRRRADARDHPARANRRTRPRGRAPRRAGRGAGGVRAPGARDQRSADGGGEGRAAHHRRRAARAPRAHPCTSTRSRARATTAGSCSPGVARARCPRHWCATVPAPRAPRSIASWPPSAATACWWSCGTTAIRSTATATTRWRASRWRRASTSSPPTTCTTPRPRSVRSPPRSPRSAAGRSLDEIDGWLPAAPFAHLRSAGEQERRFARWPGAVARTVEIARVRARSTCASPRPSSPTTTCPTVTPR